MTKRCLRQLMCVVVLVAAGTTPTFAEPLDVAAGGDPGGAAIALITPPFNLSDEVISQKLARDGEGVAVGWDFSKRPKSSVSEADGQAKSVPPQIATTLATGTGVRLVPAFVDPLRPATWAQAVAFVAQTPARIVVVPFATNMETDWVAFRAAAQHFPQLLFIVPAQSIDRSLGEHLGADNELSYPAAFHLSNVLSVGGNGRAPTDIVVNAGSQTASPDTALVLTLKSLLFCPSKHDMAEPSLSKLEALVKLGTLNSSQPTPEPTSGPMLVTPCAEALN